MEKLKSKIIILILAVSLIGLLGGFAESQNENINDGYVLTIRAYKLGYLKGRIDEMESSLNKRGKVDIEAESRKNTLDYIKHLGLGKKYYKYAEN